MLKIGKLKQALQEQQLYHYIYDPKLKARITKEGLRAIDETDPKQVNDYHGRGKSTKEIYDHFYAKKMGPYKNYGVYLTPVDFWGANMDHLQLRSKTSAIPRERFVVSAKDVDPESTAVQVKQRVDRLSRADLSALMAKYKDKDSIARAVAKDDLAFKYLPQVVSFKSIPPKKLRLERRRGE